VIVVSSRDLPRIKAKLKELGDGNTIPREVGKEIRKEVPLLRSAVKTVALHVLPKRGGLNVWVASATVRASIRYGARTAGVSVRMGRNSQGGRSDLEGIDAGVVRHPTFGRRGAKTRKAVPNAGFGRRFTVSQSANDWHDQAVTPGYFTATLKDIGLGRIRAASQRAIRAAIVKLGLDG
jgi:hypothetical protein